jgi:excisionase family DNA binding protein
MSEVVLIEQEALLAIVREAVAEAMSERTTAAPVSPWLTAAEAGEYLRTSEAAIRSMLKRRELPASRTANGRVLLARDDLDRFARGGDGE